MPDLYDSIALTDAIGPGFPNRPEDLARIGTMIEERSGASPFADLPDDGTAAAGGLTPGFRGGIQAYQIATGNDPDGVVLPDGQTLDTMNGGGGGFAPIPKIKATVGSGGPNRPEDLATAQSNLARVGYAPRPVDPSAPGYRRVDKATVTRGFRAYQRNNGFKVDSFMNPGGETETELHRQIGRQQKALESVWTKATQNILRAARAGDGAVRGVADLAGAKALAGSAVAGAVGRQQSEQRDEVRAVGDELEAHAGAGIGVILPRPLIIPRPFVTPFRPAPPLGPRPPILPPVPRRIPVPDSDDPAPSDRREDESRNTPHDGPLPRPEPFKAKRRDDSHGDGHEKRTPTKSKLLRPKPGSRKRDGAGKRFSKRTKREAHLQAQSRCVYCGKRTNHKHGPQKQETDHAIPQSRGGDNSLDNANNSCRTCNRQKRDLTPPEFDAWKRQRGPRHRKSR